MEELELYTTVTDEDIDAMTNRREFNRRSNNGITVIAYWLMREQVVLMYVHDARVNQYAEYEVDPADVTEEFHHPFANKNTFSIDQYAQGSNDE